MLYFCRVSFSLYFPCTLSAWTTWQQPCILCLLSNYSYATQRKMKNGSRTRASVVFPQEQRASVSITQSAPRPAASTGKGAAMQFVSKSARSEMEAAFDRLHALDKSVQSDSIGGKGLAQLLSEVGVSPLSLEYMVLVWKLGATQQGCIARPEWLKFVYAKCIESITQLRQKLGEWVKDVRENEGSFLLMYNYLYDYVRGEEDRHMTLGKAIKGWDIFFNGKERYAQWKAWAAVNLKGGVSRDLWRQLGIFFTMDSAAPQLSRDQVSALPWPSAIADFVDKDAAAQS
ncbi:hypothetical protein JKF63_01996 [Porcisia hertigi]|uniref:Defective in cullin neddylation protein n=1 Tax=Porcisia hertigi TaxID=2761500 RepID=A0A836HJ62_9TRYP|nr:hypothetical protein JKF63_01996 [Porcisia hertigi]